MMNNSEWREQRERFENYWRSHDKDGNLDLAPEEWGNGPGAYMWEDTANAWAMWRAAFESSALSRDRWQSIATQLAESHRQIAADGTDHLACQVSRDALSAFNTAMGD